MPKRNAENNEYMTPGQNTVQNLKKKVKWYIVIKFDTF